MFIGEYIYKLDQKKRLAIPKNFRKFLGKKAIVTKGLDYCLFLYPFKEWEKLAKKLSSLPISQKDARGFVRLMLAGAKDVEFDKLGRILLPEYLRRYGKLNKEIVIVGLYNRIEIWAKEVWEKYKKETEGGAEEIAERLKELGI